MWEALANLANRGYSSTSSSLAAICHSHPSPKALSIPTFQNSVSQTTVDYILVSHNTTEYIQQCFTHDPAPLNNSDHLPITAMLQFPLSTAIPQENLTKNRLHWAKALKGTHLRGYQKSVSTFVAPLIGRSYSSAKEINDEITNISEKICSAALQSLPLRKSLVKENKLFIKIRLFLVLLLQRKQLGTSGLQKGGAPQ